MIDRLKTCLTEAGLTLALDGLREERVSFLPEPACFSDRTLLLLDGVDSETQLRSAIGAIALDVYRKFDEAQDQQWSNALFQVKSGMVQQVQQTLQQADSFEAAVKSLESPVTRLVAIHLFNSLVKSGTSFASAKTVNLSQCGGTADLVSGTRLCSLLPLLGAYAPAEVYGYFPTAIACLALDQLRCVTHSEVREVFSGILRECFNG